MSKESRAVAIFISRCHFETSVPVCRSVSFLLSMAAVFQISEYSKLRKKKKKKVNLKFWETGIVHHFHCRNKVLLEPTTALPMGISLPEPKQLLDFRGSFEPREFLQTSPFYVCCKWLRKRVLEQIALQFRQPLLVLTYPGSACSLDVSWGTYCSRWKWRGKIGSAAEEWWFIWT